MYETEDNFMQIINNDDYGFQNMINEINNSTTKIDRLSYDVVEPLATSPANKRGIYQALKIVDEIVKYIGYEPSNIMIEMARSDEKKERKDNKKKYLENLYNKSKEQIENYNKLIKQLNETEIDTQKMFLYFIQEGKCLYSGKPLNIEDLKEYEIDHIIPRTLIKDDSIDNKALVYRECNQNKAASYVLPKEYRDKNIVWWKHLKSINLISAKKFHNLVRKEYKPFNCRNQSYGLKVKIEDKPIIVEGTYSLLVEDVYDLRIFLNCSNETQLKRLREREEDIKNFTDIWLVKEKAYFDKLDIKKKTDMIINTDKYF